MIGRRLASLRRRLRREDGFGLVELMIAMTVLNVGILAVFAGFSSGYSALNRASRTSSGAVLADAQLERFRAVRFSTICLTDSTTDSTHTAGAPSGTDVATCSTSDPALVTIRTPVTGPDNRLYRIDTYVVWNCAVGTLSTAAPFSATAPGCVTGSVQRASALKRVRVTVRDNATIARVYANEESTFDMASGV